MSVDMSLGAKGGRFLHGLGATRRERGTVAALLLGVRWATAFARKQYLSLRTQVDDGRTGLDTAADYPEAERPENPAHDDAVHYAPVPPGLFTRMMRDLDILTAGYTFVDLGCGKAAAMVAAAEQGFASVVGVELNGRLAAIARRNVAMYEQTHPSYPPIEVIEGDVVDFDFPAAPTVLFLYNPFGAETLKTVMDNLEISLRRHPRDLYIAYVSPVHGSVLDGLPWLRRIPVRSPRWSAYRVTDPAAATITAEGARG